jgi:ATP-dependent RNA helicase RhlE
MAIFDRFNTMTFTTLGLCEPLCRAIAERDYRAPTPIQQQAIPPLLAGRDLLAAAQTGTGKSAAFILPLLQRLAAGGRVRPNRVRALVLVPTRELAAQLAESVAGYGKYLPLSCAVAFGGVKINPQMMRLRKGADLLVATPGRLLDLYRQNAVRFDQLEMVVLDEADRLLDLGFSHEITQLLALLPRRRQSLLLSATLSPAIRDLAQGLLHDPVEIALTPLHSAAETVSQRLYAVDQGRKAALLCHLLQERGWRQLLVFTRTRQGADRLCARLEKEGLSAVAIHGDKSQGARTRALAEFKAGTVRILVATDLAARGLDIAGLPQVINFELPKVAQEYIHRIGRTGRAGCAGEAISLVSADEVALLGAVENLLGQTLEREVVAGFAPAQPLAPTHLNPAGNRPKKPKKPKKPRQKAAPGLAGKGQG